MTTKSYERVLRMVSDQPWAIEPTRGRQILEVLAYRLTGGTFTREEIEARVGSRCATARVQAAGGDGGSQGGVIAVLGLRGVISHRIEEAEDISGPGGTSTMRFAQRFREALADQTVSAIVFDVDSPGGGADGVEELATEIFQARGEKPIVAVANAMAGSAAYWIASQADELVVTPSGDVGSIGVWAAHEDWSKALEAEGVAVTLVASGKYKVEGNPFEPLGQEARDFLQKRCDECYDAFVRAVARGRGVKASEVKAGMGQGRMLGGREAVAEKMADRVDTLEATIARLAKPSRRRSARSTSFAFA